MHSHLVRFDWAMKKLLRSKANFAILEGFLSELLKTDIKILDVLESESNKDDKNLKFNRVDLLVRLASSELVLIEVQITNKVDYLYRILFGTAKIITDHLYEGTKYADIKKVYSVSILYFDLGVGSDYIYHGTTCFRGIHDHDLLQLSTKQQALFSKDQVHQIYPEYFLIRVNQFNDVAKNSLDEWIYFLKNEKIDQKFHAKGLLEAQTKLDVMKLSPTERQSYDRYIEDLRYQNSLMDCNFKEGKLEGKLEGVAEGRAEGRVEGRAEGLAEGLAEGKLEGKLEGLREGEAQGQANAIKTIVLNMHNNGVDDTAIAKLTGLDVRAIATLIATK